MKCTCNFQIYSIQGLKLIETIQNILSLYTCGIIFLWTTIITVLSEKIQDYSNLCKMLIRHFA